jgi:D-arabinose 1-dehydrogenase-like Zn-dependent alcohol dehydrogenase
MQIRAYAIDEIGGTAEPFLYERTLGSRDVLVKITHRSLARGDIQFIDNAWGDTRFPLVPSHEIVGIVEEAGSDVAVLHPGDRVGIGYPPRGPRRALARWGGGGMPRAGFMLRITRPGR